MFHVFNLIKKQIKAGVILFLFFQHSAASAFEVAENSFDPMEVFHEEDRPSSVESHYRLISKHFPLHIKVYVINQDEPYMSPLTFRVFLQCENGHISELNRLVEKGSVKTYCQVKAPEILKNPAFFQDDGEYLVLLAYSFDQQKSFCDLDSEQLEVYPVQELIRLCESKD